MHHFRTTRSIAGALSLVLALAPLGAAVAAEPPMHIRGTIESAGPERLTVKTADGSVNIAFDTATKIAGVVPSSLDQIKEGTFVGIANVPGSGASKALEVVVFPDAMKGSGLGDYAWDLAPPASAGGAKTSAMTNGTVKVSKPAAGAAKTSAMTNGTVKKTSTAHGMTLTVDYGKGEKSIQVPASVPVVGIVPADAGKLMTGAHVFIATKEGAPTSAAFIAVGLDGTIPPM